MALILHLLSQTQQYVNRYINNERLQPEAYLLPADADGHVQAREVPRDEHTVLLRHGHEGRGGGGGDEKRVGCQGNAVAQRRVRELHPEKLQVDDHQGALFRAPGMHCEGELLWFLV